MADLNYKISFNTENLKRDIADRLGAILRDKSFEERYKIADKTIDALLELGNYAIYYGMVEYGLKIIMNRFVTNDEEA